MKIYVASSWRNPIQHDLVVLLRNAGHEVYDFKNPQPGNDGFHWSEIDGGWESWTIEQYQRALSSPIADEGFRSDHAAMEWADVCVLVLPCGRSAHLEAGWCAHTKPTLAYTRETHTEPELMYKEFTEPYIVNSDLDLFRWIHQQERTLFGAGT